MKCISVILQFVCEKYGGVVVQEQEWIFKEPIGTRIVLRF